MFHLTFSARIQYSRLWPPSWRIGICLAEARTVLPSAAFTFGGTLISDESSATLAARSVRTFWPASVHRNAPPAPTNSSRRPKGSRSTAPLLLDCDGGLHHRLVVRADELVLTGH